MKKEESKFVKILLVLLIIVVIILTVISVVYIINKNGESNNNSSNNTYGHILDIDYENSLHVSGERTSFEIDNEIIYEEEPTGDIEPENNGIIKKNSNIDKDYFINDDVISLRTNNDDITNLYYNEKEIFSFDKNHMVGKKVNTFGDTIVFSVYDSESTDMTILIYYPGLDSPMVLFDPDVDLPSIDIPLFIKEFESTDDSLRITADCIFPGTDMLLYAKSAGSLVHINSCEVYKKYKDFEIGKVFELKYSPSEEKKFTKFSDGIVESIKLSDIENGNSLCSK